MKFYKLFFNDFTDANGNKIEIGNKYSNDSIDCYDICVYFDLDSLCKSFEDKYYSHMCDSYLMDFSIYEVDLEGDVEFRKDINAFCGKCINILKEIDYSIFKERSTYRFDTIVNIIKNKNEKLINKHFGNDIFIDAAIAFFGRDCDLNEFIKNKESRNEVIENILVHKRKKDLNKYIKNNSDSVKTMLAKYGDDEILDKLIAEDNYFTREKIINRKRIKDLKFYLSKKDLNVDLFIKIIEFKIDELFPLILEQRNHYKTMYSDMDDAIYKSYGDKSLPYLLDTTSEHVIEKLLELNNEKYINYFLEKGNYYQKCFLLDNFQNFDHAKKLLFDEDPRIREEAFSVLMNNDNRDLFREKLNS